jgi:hypothetical protein
VARRENSHGGWIVEVDIRRLYATVLVVFERQAKQDDPAQLVFHGAVSLPLEIPFVLRNVPSPKVVLPYGVQQSGDTSLKRERRKLLAAPSLAFQACVDRE